MDPEDPEDPEVRTLRTNSHPTFSRMAAKYMSSIVMSCCVVFGGCCSGTLVCSTAISVARGLRDPRARADPTCSGKSVALGPLKHQSACKQRARGQGAGRMGVAAAPVCLQANGKGAWGR